MKNIISSKIKLFIIIFLLLNAFSILTLAESIALQSQDIFLGDDFMLEIEIEPKVTTQTTTISLDGRKPKPGEKPKLNVFGIEVPARLNFEYSFTSSTAQLFNPSSSTMIVVYQLRISIAELLNQAGITGYNETQYALLSSQAGFDPESSYIVLSQTKGILPGGSVNEMSLGTLPDGSTLPAGSYISELVMVPFDAETRLGAMVSASVIISFIIENDVIRLQADENQKLALSIFNPVHSGQQLSYSIQISQAEIERVSGSSHQSPENLDLQSLNPFFDPEYEFISFFDSDVIAPGEFLESAQLQKLPDGQSLPIGEYKGWLVRYEVDAISGEKILLDVNTQVFIMIK